METNYARGMRSRNAAFALIELLVVIEIIGIWVGLLLHAVQSAREATRRVSYSDNMRLIGLATLNYETTYQRLPSLGRGTNFQSTPPSTVFDMHSAFTAILPYLEQSIFYQQMDPRFAYKQTSGNIEAAKQVVIQFICPSNSLRSSPQGSDGYGYTDYGPIYNVDLDPVTGLRNESLRAEGALVKGGSRLASVSDGTSNTVFFGEDIGRDSWMQVYHVYLDPLESKKCRY